MIKDKVVRERAINSKKKGNRFELKVANLFKKHWGVTAYRTPSSGAYTSRQVSRAMKEAAMGDVVIEELPEFVIECKNYYSLHLTNWFKEKPGEQSIFGFWNKLADEAVKFKKIPILICKEKSSPIVAITSLSFANIIKDYTGKFNNFFSMVRDNNYLVAFDFDELLTLDLKQIKVIIEDMGGRTTKRTTYAANYFKKRGKLIL